MRIRLILTLTACAAALLAAPGKLSPALPAMPAPSRHIATLAPVTPRALQNRRSPAASAWWCAPSLSVFWGSQVLVPQVASAGWGISDSSAAWGSSTAWGSPAPLGGN